MSDDITVYNSSQRVLQVIHEMIRSDENRRQNRALIDQVMDGMPPFTEQEAIDNNIETNVNFLEGTTMMHDARNQYRNAFMKPGAFFTVAVDGYRDHTGRMKSGKTITRCMNRIMKRSVPYMETLKAQFANVALHGMGPAIWPDREKWCPRAYGMNDILIPDKTYLDLSNLTYFAVYREYTAYEFWKMTKDGARGWNKEMVSRILARTIHRTLRGDQERINDYKRWKDPELINEEVKEGAGYYHSDAVPVIRVWVFYCRDLRKMKGWLRYIVPYDTETEYQGESIDDFIFKSKRQYASSHTEIAHFQFGNVSNKAPFRVHTIRSLGFLLYSPAQLLNRIRCRRTDATMENLLWYFRMQDPADRDRVQRVDLHHLGIIPEGIDIVGREDRWQPDAGFVDSGIMQLRQLMGEAAVSYRGNPEGQATNQNMTATEAQARMNSAQQMVLAILGSAYDYAKFQYQEIARRFLIKNSDDPDVQEFRDKMNKNGVRAEHLNMERWEIEPVRTLGGGNKFIETQQAQLLMSIRPLLDPDAQRKTLHLFVEANTDDPALADEMVPMDAQQFPSQSLIEGQQTAAALLMGVPIGIMQEVNRNEYITGMLQALTAKVQQINEAGGVPESANELRGMMNLSMHIKQNLEILEQDKGQNQLTQSLKNMVARADNMIRAFGQRLAEKMKAEQARQGMTPEAMAEIQQDMVVTRAKAQNKQMAAGQAAQQKQIAFQADEARKQQAHEQELARKQQETQIDLSAKAMEVQVDAMAAVESARQR